MNKIAILFVSLLLVGCQTTLPVARKFPDIPPELRTGCPELEEAAKETAELSKLLDVVVVNYGTYYECRIKNEAWLEWHSEQKKIFESVR